MKRETRPGGGRVAVLPPPERLLRLEPADRVQPLRLSSPLPAASPAAGAPVAAPRPAPTAPRRGARRDAAPETPWTGEALRRAREARGLSLPALADRTKVTAHQLESVEAERLDELPPQPYLRGILVAIARELRLDAEQVARSYLGAAGAAGDRAR
jgi:hypothetical protein